MGKNNNKKEKIADRYGLPKDVILGASIVSITDNRDMLVENFKKISIFLMFVSFDHFFPLVETHFTTD